MQRRKSERNARIRVAHLKPTSGKRRWSIKGKMMPPTLPPVLARPVVAARRLSKKCAMEPIAGVKIREEPTPQRTEYVKMKCQSSSMGKTLANGLS